MPEHTRPAARSVRPGGASREEGSSRVIAFPRVDAPERPPDNLPLQLSSFVGREREMKEVKRLLTETRLLTLTGPGGCGKTRLALRVTQGLIEAFEDGVWLVELASVADPELVAQTVASTLGVREQPGRSLSEMLLDHMRPKKMLLVLDNGEHLIEACAELADALLRACPELYILATSREALDLAGEVRWSVPSLSLPDPHHPRPIEELTQYEAVRLFVERAAAVAPGFALTERNASSVARVCSRLEGMPLAIELAASRVKVLAVEQIAERLDDCFRLLTSGARAALPHHQTLRATMDWSYDLLSGNEQNLFRRLSVFAGGFTLATAEKVCTGGGVEKDHVLELLSRLVDKSLVSVEEQGGEARYRVLETVRQYAGEKLDDLADEAAQTKLRHADCFLHLAEQAEQGMLGSEQAAWMGRLEREHDNLRLALGLLRRNRKVEQGLRLGGALGRFWWFRGYYTEGRAWLEEYLGLPEASGRTAARAKALYALGGLIGQNADYSAGAQDVARSRLRESIEIYRELGDVRRTAAVLRVLGALDVGVGAWERARSSLEESLELARQSGDKQHFAMTRSDLGAMYLLRGEHGPARAQLGESLRILRGVGTQEIRTCLFRLGFLACDEGEYAEARARFTEMMRDNPLQHYRHPAPWVLQAYARLAACEGHPARALRLAGAASRLHHAIGTTAGPAYEAYFRRGLLPAWKALGEEEGKAAWREGERMALEEAIAYALEESSSTTPSAAEANTPQELRIFALGPVRVERGEEELASSEWTYAKSRELLFYLLSHPSRTKSQIALELWPEASPSQLRRTFHTTLHHLRQALGGTQWIVFEKGRYSFNRSLGYFYDVEAFESRVARARRLLEGEGPARAISHLKKAVELYKGDFLEHSSEGEWALIRQEELRRTYQEALLALGELLFDEGLYGEATQTYRKAIEHEKYSEIAHRGLMRCHARMGERGQALRHYRRLVELLDEELGTSPDPETTNLYERLRQSEES